MYLSHLVASLCTFVHLVCAAKTVKQGAGCTGGDLCGELSFKLANKLVVCDEEGEGANVLH